MDFHVPLMRGNQYLGGLVATYTTASILDQLVPWWFAQENEVLLTDSDDTVLDRRASGGPGRNVYTHSRALDLPGVAITLRTNSIKSEPRLLPNLLVGSVIVLSLGLLWSLSALWRDTTAGLPPRTRCASRWRSAPRWKIRWSPACARATSKAASPM